MYNTFYRWHFEEFFGDLRDKVVKNIEKEDSKYKALAEAVFNGERDIIKNLPEKERSSFENYIDQIYDLNYMEQKSLYMQGFKDCMRFLRKAYAFHE